MIAHHFPRPCPPEGWPSLVIHARGRGIEYAEHEAPLSIKCVLEGREVHEVRGIPYVVAEDSYLLLNHGRRYSSRIGPEAEAETFSIFFEHGFAGQTLRTLVEPADRLLDEPNAGDSQSVDFVESLYPRDSALTALIGNIKACSDGGRTNGPALDERLYAVLAYLLSRHTDLLRRVDRLPAIRHSTRIEQYRRLRRARDFIDACFADELALQRVARVACLSPYHLLRLFKQAFGLTPHEYLTHKRFHHARELLESSDLPVSEICQRVGYQSLGSFSQRFKSRFGASPGKYRSAHRRT